MLNEFIKKADFMKVAQLVKNTTHLLLRFFLIMNFDLCGEYFFVRLDELHVCYKNLSIIFKYD